MTAPLILRRSWLNIERAYLNLYGRPITLHHVHPKGEGLLERLMAFPRRYLVDNHVPWREFARDRRLRETAFIVGTTTLNEHPTLFTLFENATGPRFSLRNIFHFGAQNIEVDSNAHILRGVLVLDRLTQDLISAFDPEKLRTIGDFSSPLGFEKPTDEAPVEIYQLKRVLFEQVVRVLRHRAAGSATLSLEEQIHARTGGCAMNYRNSVVVARMCVACLLIRDPQARRKFKSSGSVNAYGDAGLIKDALFLKAGILSNDRGVARMARFAGVECSSVPTGWQITPRS